MRLAKLHGLGNDFLVCRSDEIGAANLSLAALAQAICRRRLGIGADGVLFYQPTVGDTEADVSALIYNADGSRAEMSGNGTRCLAAFLIHSGKTDNRCVRIRTVSGVKTFTLRERKDRCYLFESVLGQPVTAAASIPVRVGSDAETVIDYPLAVGSEIVRVTVTSMGNPHCSTFWPDVSRAPLENLGPALAGHDSFPNRTNVEFIQVLSRNRLRVRFWERGVGPTLASGTGSAAAAVAAILNRVADSPVTVDVELGSMTVQWEPPGELVLIGPAEFIGDIDLPASLNP